MILNTKWYPALPTQFDSCVTDDCSSIYSAKCSRFEKEDGADVNRSRMQTIVIQSAPFLQVKHSAQTTVYSVYILKLAVTSMWYIGSCVCVVGYLFWAKCVYARLD